ncbi:MAG: PAS domain S-box protein [Thermodesulfobacteriota bacterium]|nr:PAS domain S-box protein [Thermodesulfobacteriota bacterium]
MSTYLPGQCPGLKRSATQMGNMETRPSYEELENQVQLLLKIKYKLKLTENALLESEKRYRSLIDFLPLPFLITQEERIVFVNPAVLELFGLKEEEEIIGTSPGDWMQPGSKLTAIHRHRQTPDKTGPIEPVEMRIVRNDRPATTVLNNTVWITHNGLPGALTVLQDITERKRTEKKIIRQKEALQESEARFKALHDFYLGGIAIHDQGVVLECNQVLSEMTGFKYSELIGMNVSMLIAENSRNTVLDNILTGHEKPYEEGMGLHKDGSEFHLRIRTRKISYKGRQVRYTEFRDISDQKRAELEKEEIQAQLNQAQKLESVGRLAGGVAHDFNNMLGVILGHTELARLKTDKNHDLLSDLNGIQKAAEHSTDLTRQLLAFARKQTFDPRQLDLNATVESMLKILRRLIGEDIDLVWKPDVHIWPVKMDPSQIDQILANLCVNARDAIAGVGKLIIETGIKIFDDEYCNEHPDFIPGNFVMLAVSDNGCGMDKETLDKLFDPFFTTKEIGKGTGLGLATVYGIVKQNNGFINVYSEPGQGSFFKIYLPRFGSDKTPDKTIPEKNTAAGGTETILLVEDEPSILKITRMMLERNGYTVLSADTPALAMEKAKNHSGSIALLMTDVVMPEMNGRDLAGQISRLYPDIRVLFMSGYTADVIAHQGILGDGLAFIQKPFSMADMTEKIRNVLDMATVKNQR